MHIFTQHSARGDGDHAPHPPLLDMAVPNVGAGEALRNPLRVGPQARLSDNAREVFHMGDVVNGAVSHPTVSTLILTRFTRT